jgi:hypothetical protein
MKCTDHTSFTFNVLLLIIHFFNCKFENNLSHRLAANLVRLLKAKLEKKGMGIGNRLDSQLK